MKVKTIKFNNEYQLVHNSIEIARIIKNQVAYSNNLTCRALYFVIVRSEFGNIDKRFTE